MSKNNKPDLEQVARLLFEAREMLLCAKTAAKSLEGADAGITIVIEAVQRRLTEAAGFLPLYMRD